MIYRAGRRRFSVTAITNLLISDQERAIPEDAVTNLIALETILHNGIVPTISHHQLPGQWKRRDHSPLPAGKAGRNTGRIRRSAIVQQ
jgi:hypothetical protein